MQAYIWLHIVSNIIFYYNYNYYLLFAIALRDKCASYDSTIVQQIHHVHVQSRHTQRNSILIWHSEYIKLMLLSVLKSCSYYSKLFRPEVKRNAAAQAHLPCLRHSAENAVPTHDSELTQICLAALWWRLTTVIWWLFSSRNATYHLQSQGVMTNYIHDRTMINWNPYKHS